MLLRERGALSGVLFSIADVLFAEYSDLMYGSVGISDQLVEKNKTSLYLC